MKLSDAPSVEVETVVAAPVAVVWSLASDLPRMGEWSPENMGGHWESDGPGVGAQFRGRNRHEAIGEWETTAVVTEYEPPSRITWIVGSADVPSATWTFALESHGEDTRLRQKATIGPGPSGLSAAITRMPDKEDRIVARRLEEHERNMKATIEGIKKSAESR